MNCPDCDSTDLIKRGLKNGYQRYQCKACGRHSTDKPPKFSARTKAMAIEMYFNSVGIRSIGRVLKASPASVLKWIRKEHAALQARPEPAKPSQGAKPDIIEMDEIYTYVQKNSSGQ